MFKAFTGALSLALTILVLRLVLPEVADPLISIITQVLQIANQVINQIDVSKLKI